MSYEEKAVGSQMYFVFGLALLLVYFVLAGQYESWILPLAVILGVPLALLGTVGAMTAVGAANDLYTQIGLILLTARQQERHFGRGVCAPAASRGDGNR
jgi:hydrophobic/amphiphilic exporter-1 (mainly G- bacteria), HAE1 family